MQLQTTFAGGPQPAGMGCLAPGSPGGRTGGREGAAWLLITGCPGEGGRAASRDGSLSCVYGTVSLLSAQKSCISVLADANSGAAFRSSVCRGAV